MRNWEEGDEPSPIRGVSSNLSWWRVSLYRRVPGAGAEWECVVFGLSYYVAEALAEGGAGTHHLVEARFASCELQAAQYRGGQAQQAREVGEKPAACLSRFADLGADRGAGGNGRGPGVDSRWRPVTGAPPVASGTLRDRWLVSGQRRAARSALSDRPPRCVKAFAVLTCRPETGLCICVRPRDTKNHGARP